VRLNLRDAIEDASEMLIFTDRGYAPEDFRYFKEKGKIASYFGQEYVDRKIKDDRRRNSLENRRLSYDDESFELNTMKNCHTDAKPWLDYTDENNIPIQISSTTGTTRWHDGEYNYSEEKVIIYQFLDTETLYKTDFEIGVDEVEDDAKDCLTGKTAHIKYIYAEKENQQGYFKMNKTVKRVASILFGDGVDKLEGWCFPQNEKKVNTSKHKNWRKVKVYGRDREGHLSDTMECKLFWLYMYSGWVVVGVKQDQPMIAYISKSMHEYFKNIDPENVERCFKFARNFSYEN